MKILRNLSFAILSLTFGATALVSCKDEIPAESYYTFTGEMMSDYLDSHSNFSKFSEIVKRSAYSDRGVNLYDLISLHGQYTCLAPTNQAVQEYMDSHGYKSVSDIPYNVCDTIARTHLINGRVFNTSDLVDVVVSGKSGSLPLVNMNQRYLSVYQAYSYIENGDTIITSDRATAETHGIDRITYQFNRSGIIIPQLANDSVTNGIVQPVSQVIESSNETAVYLMTKNPNISLFNEALSATGLYDYINNRVMDISWDATKYEGKSVYTGAQFDYCHVPDTKYYGYTLFACPDKVLARRYNITNLQEFYDYARSIYGGKDIDVSSAEGKQYLKTDKKNPLRRLIGYNILGCKGLYDNLTTICTIETQSSTLGVNPTEWYATLDSLTTLKVECLKAKRLMKLIGGVEGDLYLNRSDAVRSKRLDPGIHVDREVEGGYDNEGLNGVYYTTDGLVDFGEQTKTDIFNQRIRVELYTLFPELITNNIRDGRTTNKIADSNNPDKAVTSPNYWFPNGYLDNVKINAEGTFLFQSQHNTYWSYEGDEFNLQSNSGSYDITFNLPSVPTGTYQIRLGFAPMSSRGICQFYLNGEAGNPFDQRNENFNARSGWFHLQDAKDQVAAGSLDKDKYDANKKNMHNLGWYHGPQSVFNIAGEGHPDGSSGVTKNYFCNQNQTMRYVLASNVKLDENQQNTIRIKSLWAPDKAVVMIDYIELVPKEVYSVEGTGLAEDDL